MDSLLILEDTARYAGLLVAPAEVFGLRPRDFCPSGKRKLIRLVWPILDHFLCPVVTLVTFISNFGNFKKNPKVHKQI